MTVEAVAKDLKVTPDEVRGLIAAGALKTTGSGDDLRVTPDSLLIYMTSRLKADLSQVMKRPSGLSIFCSAMLPIVMVLWFLAACVEVFSIRDRKPIAPVPYAVVVLGLTLAIAWWMGRQSDDFSSTNGVGTTLYGKRETPEGRVGTQWLIFAGVPLLPIRSYVILEAAAETANWSGAIRSRKYRLRSMDRIYWPQALPLMAAVWAGLGAVIAAFVLL